MSHAQLAGAVPEVAADPEQIRRLWRNFIVNAQTAIPHDDTITTRTETLSASVVLDVCDTGDCLTTEECEGLFTLNYTIKQNGNGLRLAIAPSVVGDHGGIISAGTAKGVGLAFQVEIPRNGRHE